MVITNCRRSIYTSMPNISFLKFCNDWGYNYCLIKKGINNSNGIPTNNENTSNK